MSAIKKINVNGQDYDLAGAAGSGTSMVEITYSELKALVDSSSLIQGAKYRITDFVSKFKTIQSANHQFDLVVEALGSNKLSEKAYAMHHEGDSYFANSKLENWVVFYSFENNTGKFQEATTEGKGYIYRMIDEWGNDLPYDFKNVLIPFSNKDNSIIESTSELLFYTFTVSQDKDSFKNQGNIEDMSLTGNVSYNTYYPFYSGGVLLTLTPFCIAFTKALLGKSIVKNNEVHLTSSPKIITIKASFNDRIENNVILFPITSTGSLKINNSIIRSVTSTSYSLEGEMDNCDLSVGRFRLNGYKLKNCKFIRDVNVSIGSDINNCIVCSSTYESGIDLLPRISQVDNCNVCLHYSTSSPTATIINYTAKEQSSLFDLKTLTGDNYS